MQAQNTVYSSLSISPLYIIELYLQDVDIAAALVFANKVGPQF